MFVFGCAAALIAGFAFAEPAAADGKKRKAMQKSPEVAGSSRRIGGYSYDYNDAIIDYGDRTILEAPNIYEPTGPLDSDFFFDSNITPYGSDAPYMN